MIPGGVVDTHIHLWDLDAYHYPWLNDPSSADLRWNYVADDYQHDADAAYGDISGKVLASVHVQAELDHAVDPVEETSWLASQAAKSSDDGLPTPTVCVGYADLRSAGLADTLDRHQQHAFFRGIRQEAWFDPASVKADVPRHNLLDDPTWRAGLRMLQDRDLSFDLLVWPHQLAQAATIFRELPGLTLVLEHTGLPVDPTPEQRAMWRAAMRHFATEVPHALLKISALRFVSPTWDTTELRSVVREAIEIFGPHRCMFGSNFPVDKPAISYAGLWRTFDELTADLSPTERSAMFRDNAARAYRLDL